MHKQYQSKITLSTPDGEKEFDSLIICHDEDVCSSGGDAVKAPSVLVGIEYEGKKIWGRGKEYLWFDAFADLQRQLPDAVKLKCCLTCRHGNLCPFGNTPGEVFCTKDVIIQHRNDVMFYTENDAEREKRSRNCTDTCQDYQEQSEDYYTYNDYIFYVK